jgi:hypothetical protein
MAEGVSSCSYGARSAAVGCVRRGGWASACATASSCAKAFVKIVALVKTCAMLTVRRFGFRRAVRRVVVRTGPESGDDPEPAVSFIEFSEMPRTVVTFWAFLRSVVLENGVCHGSCSNQACAVCWQHFGRG